MLKGKVMRGKYKRQKKNIAQKQNKIIFKYLNQPI